MKLTEFLGAIYIQHDNDLIESTNDINQSLKALRDDLMSTDNNNKKLNIIGDMILAITRG